MNLFSHVGKKKKGNMVIEGLTVLVIAAVFAIGALFAYSSFDELNTDIQDNDDLSTKAKDTSGNLYSIFPSWLDNAFLLMFVLFTIFVIVSVFMIDEHPLMFAVSVILMMGVLVASIFIGNAYDDIASDSSVSSFSNNMPFMAWIMTHIVESIIGIVFITSIALFVKVRGL